MGKEGYADYQHVTCFRDVFKSVVCWGKYMQGCFNRKELMKKVVLLHNKKSSLLLYVFLLFIFYVIAISYIQNYSNSEHLQITNDTEFRIWESYLKSFNTLWKVKNTFCHHFLLFHPMLLKTFFLIIVAGQDCVVKG